MSRISITRDNPGAPSPGVRQAPPVVIDTYRDDYAVAFAALNMAWIRQFFEVEEIDKLMLVNPRKHVIEPGGEIFFALTDGEVVGTCALLLLPSGDFELAKMAVATRSRGLGIGNLLMEAAIDHARRRGAARIVLQSHASLRAAVSLYRKYGFGDITPRATEYERCNVHMALDLSDHPRRS